MQTNIDFSEELGMVLCGVRAAVSEQSVRQYNDLNLISTI